MNKKIGTPIKYFGGKNTCWKKIIEYFPNNTEYDTYIEPFGGSYSMGLKIDPIPAVEIYNDLEQNVYSLYKVLSDKDLYPKFKEMCDLAIYSDDVRREYKDLLKGDLHIIYRAFYFFYVNRTSHNGVGGFSVNPIIRRGMSKSISDFLSCIDRMPELHERLSRVIVSNTDGIELIKKYNRSNVFFYLDPPYEQSTRTSTRYPVDMDREQQKSLLSAVIESNAKILISGYECELYEELVQNGFEKISFEVKTIGGDFKPKTKTETLWKNY